jgi:hypothetical protein
MITALTEKTRININVVTLLSIISSCLLFYNAYANISTKLDSMIGNYASKNNLEEVGIYIVKKHLTHISFDEELKIRADFKKLMESK